MHKCAGSVKNAEGLSTEKVSISLFISNPGKKKSVGKEPVRTPNTLCHITTKETTIPKYTPTLIKTLGFIYPDRKIIGINVNAELNRLLITCVVLNHDASVIEWYIVLTIVITTTQVKKLEVSFDRQLVPNIKTIIIENNKAINFASSAPGRNKYMAKAGEIAMKADIILKILLSIE